MATITLSDGRTVDLRIPVWLSEKSKLVEWERNQAETPALDLFNALADIIRAAVIATSWDGDVTDMDELSLVRLIRDWTQATDEAVLPEANGIGSETS